MHAKETLLDEVALAASRLRHAQEPVENVSSQGGEGKGEVHLDEVSSWGSIRGHAMLW